MQGLLNPDQLATWKVFLRAHASLMRVFEQTLQAEHGIALTWLDVLVQLSLEPEQRMTHKRLGERMTVAITGSGITRLVDRMAAAGLLRREPSSEDRRQSYVVMTDEGAAALDRALPTQEHDVYERFARHLRDEDSRVLFSFLKRVLGEE